LKTTPTFNERTVRFQQGEWRLGQESSKIDCSISISLFGDNHTQTSNHDIENKPH